MTVWIDLLLIVIAAFTIFAVISFIIISVTTGWKKTGRLSGGLYCITAPPSNGKSFFATYLSIQFMREGRRVFSNYPIIFDNGRERYVSKVLTKDMILKENLNGSVIIIDEAHNWFWSRDFKKFSEEYKNWFSTLAQHQISLYYIVQHEDRVDTIINDCANLFATVAKTDIPFLDMPIYFEVTWWNTELEMQMSKTRSDVEPYHFERVWFDKDVAFAFDTCWFGKDKRPEYEGMDWIEYLKLKGLEFGGSYKFSMKTMLLNKIHYSIKIPLLCLYDKLIKSLANIIIYMTDKGKRVYDGLKELGSRFDRDNEEEEKQDEQNNIDEDLLEHE